MGQGTDKPLGSRIATILFDSIKPDFTKPRPEVWVRVRYPWRTLHPVNRKGWMLVVATYLVWAIWLVFIFTKPPAWMIVTDGALFLVCGVLAMRHSEREDRP